MELLLVEGELSVAGDPSTIVFDSVLDTTETAPINENKIRVCLLNLVHTNKDNFFSEVYEDKAERIFF